MTDDLPEAVSPGHITEVFRGTGALALRGFRSELRICPAEKTAVIVFINADDGETWMYMDKAFEWVGGAISGVTKQITPPADPAWSRYVGRYRNAWGDVQILVRGGELIAIGRGGPDPLLITSTHKP